MSKRIIVSNKQLHLINEIQINANPTGATPEAFKKAITQAGPNASKAEAKFGGDVDIFCQNPKNNGDDMTINIQSPEQLNNDEKTMRAVIDGCNVVSQKANANVTEHIYTKKQIEEARIKNIKENGVRYTKAELIEMVKNNY